MSKQKKYFFIYEYVHNSVHFYVIKGKRGRSGGEKAQ